MAVRTTGGPGAHDVLLLGAGKIGRAIAKLLADTGDYRVLVGDIDDSALARLRGIERVATQRLDVASHDALVAAMAGKRLVISACSFAVNPGIARAALAAGISYFDLTEDVATTRAVLGVSQQARPGQVFMPQCGLAPGFIAIAGHELTKGFDRLDEVRLRVGALPQFPTNEFKYNLTWSTDGLINEYCNPCEVIHDGARIDVLPLEGLEHFSLDGVDYEAFNTSGGLGTLWETLAGKVRNLDYKTVRYRGHRDLVAFLVNELRLSSRRDILKDILEHAVPVTFQDVVLVFCTVTGWKNGYLHQVTDARKIYHAQLFGESWSAIQITTASGICAVVDLFLHGGTPTQGFVRQEQVSLAAFLANRFGTNYHQHAHSVMSAGVP
ncbi:MAG: saccharopine dehydrogenase NADP-binding domain-containing protein [Planctomycetes bacterium]|nr:saccharopine dehydrogenase NADP-binding domain-containing protein [Planctomycetota bacterium]